jgi:hypothetical protein
MPSEVINLRGATLLRFLTPTEAWTLVWAALSLCRRNGRSIFVAEDGAILMTSVLDVPKSCVKAFFG